MQQRQPRLGDILDDYCPRERRLTNHAVVAMIGPDIRLTRCTTCDAEHDYKQARVPRLRKKAEAVPTALGVPIPKRLVPDLPVAVDEEAGVAQTDDASEPVAARGASHPASDAAVAVSERQAVSDEVLDEDAANDPPPPRREEGPVHRQLIRAQLPRVEGQPPVPRQAPDFTIRQPGGRPNNRFRGRPQRGGGGASFQGPMTSGNSDRSHGQGNANGNVDGNGRGAGPRSSGRPPMPARAAQRHNNGRKRSK